MPDSATTRGSAQMHAGQCSAAPALGIGTRRNGSPSSSPRKAVRLHVGGRRPPPRCPAAKHAGREPPLPISTHRDAWSSNRRTLPRCSSPHSASSHLPIRIVLGVVAKRRTDLAGPPSCGSTTCCGGSIPAGRPIPCWAPLPGTFSKHPAKHRSVEGARHRRHATSSHRATPHPHLTAADLLDLVDLTHSAFPPSMRRAGISLMSAGTKPRRPPVDVFLGCTTRRTGLSLPRINASRSPTESFGASSSMSSMWVVPAIRVSGTRQIGCEKGLGISMPTLPLPCIAWMMAPVPLLGACLQQGTLPRAKRPPEAGRLRRVSSVISRQHHTCLFLI